MKLSRMLKRENFYEIITRTMTSYNQHTYGNVESSQMKFLVFPHLNVLVVNFKSEKIKNFIRTEYSVKGSFFKRFAVNIYIELIFLFPNLFKSRTLNLKFVCSNENEVMIYPCNHRVRVFYFGTGEVDILTKYGFDDSPSLNEVSLRKGEYSDYMPKINAVSGKYYSESIIDGVPLPRITDQIRFTLLLENAHSILQRIQNNDTKLVLLDSYVKRLINLMNNKVELLEDAQLKRRLEKITNTICDVLLANHHIKIPISFSHGDLQHGNIWYNKENDGIEIIDWESGGYRTIWYDKYYLIKGKRGGQPSVIELEELNFPIYQGYDLPLISSMLQLEDIEFNVNNFSQLPISIFLVEMKEYIFTLEASLKIDGN